MDLTAVTSDDIPHLVRGHNAASTGQPFDPNENDVWKAAYMLHPRRPRLVTDNTSTRATHNDN